MKREQDRTKLLGRRAMLLGGAQVALLATLAGRMYYLQIVQSGRYTMLAEENRISIRLVAPPRGRILDRFGVALADNQSTYRVVLVAEQAGDIESTLNAVNTLVPLSDTDRRRVIRDIQRKHRFVPVTVRENLNWDEMARLEVNTLELPGVSIEQGLTRFYPFGETASHVLGYVGAVSEEELKQMGGDDPLLELPGFRIGKNGAEKAHDTELRGSAGTSEVEVNAFGRVVRELTREDGIPGQEMVLTLDMALQDLAARRCEAEQSASCVVLDAWTGDILAMASMPGYDPSAFASGLSQQLWDEYRTNPRNPLVPKAISGQYSPGSTFKPIVAMAALATGAMTPETRVNCNGQYDFGDVVFHCWKKGGHGSMNLRDGIKHSCDCYFFETSRRVGIDPIADMAKKFGLGAPLGIDLPGEKSGLIPSTQWKKGALGQAWLPGETLSCGIGQSYVQVTPLQLATQVARIATGRAVVPRLVREAGIMTKNLGDVPNAFPLLDISQKDLKLVQDGMFAVVNEQGGTAYAAKISEPGMQMAGKSGTSQVYHMSQAEREKHIKIKDIPWERRDHALFISFAPVTAPRYVCAVVVEHGGESQGGGSAVAAPICRDLLREAQKRDPARKVPAEPFGRDSTSVAQK